ncbi:phage portal protein [Mesobacillus zeae]|uniref:phage portal protein n=1 Tax=Mesobacillus zeae TaxID=1917180 RepID=UPI00300ABF30
MSLFEINEFYPHPAHKDRIQRYQLHKRLFKGDHFAILESHLNRYQLNQYYIAVNMAGIICKKSADFLFGETPVFSAGNADNSPEQKAIERLVADNDLNITNYESALANSYRGDSFYKIRWGQRYGGLIPVQADSYRTIIESQNAEYVFPEASLTDANTIIAYHVAFPQLVEHTKGEEWILHVESHYAGMITYRKFRMNPISYAPGTNEVSQWKIYAEITEARNAITTGVPFPLIVHVPNYSVDDDWQGIDDLTEHLGMFTEINNRISKIAEILDKHSDPAMAVPSGSLGEDDNGQPVFRAGRDKIFEVMDKAEVVPQYITWNGQLDAAFKELEKLIDIILMNAEIPPVALGRDNSGTSGASGLSVKWRMNSLLAKINRKRQYYEKGLKRLLLTAQLLEHAHSDEKLDYQVVTPIIKFKDGLPDDDMEQASIKQVRTGGKATQSQLSAIMELNGCTEEQAHIELARIREEEKTEGFVKSSVFNDTDEGGDE